ncbi:MAG: hypothetical protein ACRDTA_19760 [Pseudonocardiaceae bacterium]
MPARYLRQLPTLVWAPVRFLPLVVNAAYIAVLHGPSRPTGWDWTLGMVSAALTLAGGRRPMAVTVGAGRGHRVRGRQAASRRLPVGVTTVKTHVASLMAKTGTPNRVRLAVLAASGGLLSNRSAGAQ